jgi:pimeloyl-ACP methyl ester carboxylesterase
LITERERETETETETERDGERFLASKELLRRDLFVCLFMGGSSCLGLSFVEFKLKWLEYRFRAFGLRPQLVHLMDSNNTAIHCWVPWRRTGTNSKSEEEEEEEDDDDEEACGGIGSVPENKKRKKKKKKKKEKPALMLLHGFAPNALLCWENQIAAFVRDFDVYVPDLLFFGNSTTTQQREEQGEEKQRQRWSEAFQAECLMHMLQVLGVQQKQNNNNSSSHQQQQELHVLGTSYGGMVAFRMAELYPTLVSKVVFSSSGICMSPTNNDELLARNNLSHVSQLLLPSTVQQMRVGVATAIYKQNRIPDFLLRDFVEVSAMDGSSCMPPIPAKPNPPPTQSLSLFLTNFFQVLIFAQLLL